MKWSWWLALLGGVLLAAWWAGSRINAPDTQRLVPDPACDLAQGSCSLPLPDGGSLGLTLSPRPPKVMVPLQVAVAVSGPVQAVWVEFVGRNMAMGFNGVELAAANEGLWQGQIILPICTAAEMQWEARVFAQLGQTRIEAPFRFTTRP